MDPKLYLEEALEAFVAMVIRERSYLYSGKEQIVIQKFAEALEVIPLTIARNAGMNTIDIGTHLREKSILNLR